MLPLSGSRRPRSSLIVTDHDRGFFCVEGAMTDDRPRNESARYARDKSAAAYRLRSDRPRP